MEQRWGLASSGHLPGVSSDKSLPCLADNFIFQRAEEVAEGTAPPHKIMAACKHWQVRAW